MTMSRKQKTTGLAVLLTLCGAVLLIFLLGTLVMRYRTVEAELDRMLVESLTVHTAESGNDARELIDYTQLVLSDAQDMIAQDGRAPEKTWIKPMLRAVNPGGHRLALYYLDLWDMAQVDPGSEEERVSQSVLGGESVVSGAIFPENHADAYIIIAQPVMQDGAVAGELQARLSMEQLLRQDQHSSFFHSVNCAIAGAEGQVVYGSTAESRGIYLAEMGKNSGITKQESEEFIAAYQSTEIGAFYYDTAEGRSYAAWAPISYNGWRIVQFSQSPNVQIARGSMVQTIVMMVSLAACGLLAALTWRQRARLAEEKLRYDALAQFKDTLLFEYDCQDDSLEFTSNALDTLNLKELRLKGITDENNSFPVFHPDDIGQVRQMLRRMATMPPDQIEHDRTRMMRRDGTYSWYRSQYKAVPGPDGRVVRVLGTLTDISNQIDREIELRRQAQQDPLTGLYNRAGIRLINARLEQISRGVLFMLDMDDFKSVNDTYGHAAGDKLLIAIGDILRETFRTDDIVARVGGDEFVAFLSGSDSQATAEQKGQELLDRVRALKIEGIGTQASVSIGAARAPLHGRTYEALSLAADEALYHVKNSHKGGFSIR